MVRLRALLWGASLPRTGWAPAWAAMLSERPSWSAGLGAMLSAAPGQREGTVLRGGRSRPGETDGLPRPGPAAELGTSLPESLANKRGAQRRRAVQTSFSLMERNRHVIPDTGGPRCGECLSDNCSAGGKQAAAHPAQSAAHPGSGGMETPVSSHQHLIHVHCQQQEFCLLHLMLRK